MRVEPTTAQPRQALAVELSGAAEDRVAQRGVTYLQTQVRAERGWRTRYLLTTAAVSRDPTITRIMESDSLLSIGGVPEEFDDERIRLPDLPSGEYRLVKTLTEEGQGGWGAFPSKYTPKLAVEISIRD